MDAKFETKRLIETEVGVCLNRLANNEQQFAFNIIIPRTTMGHT